jgi:hypothetical protein
VIVADHAPRLWDSLGAAGDVCMLFKNRLFKIIAAVVSTAFFLWEVPWVGRTFGRVFAIVTGFDFFYERSRDPSWLGEVYRIAINPPPGTALLVALVGLALIYWTTKPKVIRMSWPVLGMLISVISLAGFGVWFLVRNQLQEPGPIQVTAIPTDIAQRLDTLESERTSLITELESTRKKLAAATHQSIPSDVTRRLAEILELEKNIAIVRGIQKDGEDIRSEKRMGEITSAGTASPIINGLVRLRDRASSMSVRQSQIFAKYDFVDITQAIGHPPDIANPCNLFINLLNNLTYPIDVNGDVRDQAAYQIFSETLIQISAWVSEKEAQSKSLRADYEKAKGN